MEDNISIITHKPHKKFTFKPAQIIVLGFLAVILLGGLLLSMPFSCRNGEFNNFLNSVFTATSATCVTGLIVVDTATFFTPIGQVIILLLIQVGGLGFMTLTTMLMVLLRRKITLRDRIVMQEALNQNANKGIVKLTRNIVFLTLFIETIGALCLMPAFIMDNGGVGVWQAIFTAVSAFCNAGFDILGGHTGQFSSLTGYATNALVSLSVCMLIVLGGIGFTVIMDILRNKGNFKKLRMHSRVVLIVSGILILFGWVFFFIAEYSNPKTLGPLNFGGKLLTSLFQSITPRTAGYNTINLVEMTHASKLMTMLFMFVGASPGSTGGGIKTTTLAILILVIFAGIKNDDNIYMSKHSLKTTNVYKAISVMSLSLILVVVTSVILLFTEQGMPSESYSMENLMFEAFSAFGTVGSTLGITPLLSSPGKIIIMLLMFFGRVGPVTIGVIFLRKNHEKITYPEGTLMIG